MQHSRKKHIEIRHHFFKEHVEEGTIELFFMPYNKQLADIFTKPLCEEAFTKIQFELGLICL